MIRLFVPHPILSDAAFPLDDGQSRYLTSVMRQGVGDEVLAFNGRDGEWRCAIGQVGKRFVILEARSQERPQVMGSDLDLLIALVKRGRLETIVEKAAELGARRIRPVVTAHTNADRVRTDRLKTIAMEAAEQTGRLDVPEILEPEKLEKMLKGWDANEGGRALLFCDEAGDAKPVAEALAGRAAGPWAILIGPEGGFSPAERAKLRALDYATPATLGPRILRADTAAISAFSPLFMAPCW